MTIAIRALVKQFHVKDGQVTALRALDLDVAEGEFFVIVGASGSGKTTLLRCVAGLETPDSGTIRIGERVVFSGQPPVCVPPQQRGLGMVFQSYAVWPHLTVYENVALPLAEGAQRVPRAEIAGRVREALGLVELAALAERSATLLSGGQQQRVALARAIAVNSRVLLMDEPLSNLDARLREDVRGRIRELAKRLGATVLYVTHDQVEAMAVADKIALLRLGELLQVGAPAVLYHQPCRAAVAEFFGQVNWLRGTARGDGCVETPIGALQVAQPTARDAAVLVGFRPECLTLAASGQAGFNNRLDGTLTTRTFLGDQVLFEVQVHGRSLAGKQRAVPAVGGEPVSLQLDPADIMVFPASEADELAEAPAAEALAAVG